MENLISEKKPKPILTDILRTSQAGKSVYQSFGEYGMFPQPQHFYSYKGTHTTPPYIKGVRWLMFREVAASMEQTKTFKKLEEENMRANQLLFNKVAEEF